MSYCICCLRSLCRPEQLNQQEKSGPNPFISFVNHIMFCISWIRYVCAFTSVYPLRPDFFFFFSPCHFAVLTFKQSHLYLSCSSFFFNLSSILVPHYISLSPDSAVPDSVHSLGSTGSETVTQGSLVIGHGHANQTGRNLQLIRTLPPAIIVHPPMPCPHKINYIWGSIPTIGFPVSKLHYERTNPKTTKMILEYFCLSITEGQAAETPSAAMCLLVYSGQRAAVRSGLMSGIQTAE